MTTNYYDPITKTYTSGVQGNQTTGFTPISQPKGTTIVSSTPTPAPTLQTTPTTTGANTPIVTPVNTNITPQNLTKGTSTTVPQVEPIVSDAGSITSLTKSLQDSYAAAIAAANSKISANQTQSDAMTKMITDLGMELSNKGTDTINAENAAGVSTMKNDKASVDAQVQAGLAEYNQMKQDYNTLSLENRNKPITMNSIIGNDAAIGFARDQKLNNKAAEVGLLQARSLGLDGQIQLAQSTADRAVDLKYADKVAVLNVKVMQLASIKEDLTKAEKEKADVLTLKYNAEKIALDNQKEKEKAIQAIMLKAAEKGASKDELAKIAMSSSVEGAIMNFKNPVSLEDIKLQLEINNLKNPDASLQTLQGTDDSGNPYTYVVAYDKKTGLPLKVQTPTAFASDNKIAVKGSTTTNNETVINGINERINITPNDQKALTAIKDDPTVKEFQNRSSAIQTIKQIFPGNVDDLTPADITDEKLKDFAYSYNRFMNPGAEGAKLAERPASATDIGFFNRLQAFVTGDVIITNSIVNDIKGQLKDIYKTYDQAKADIEVVTNNYKRSANHPELVSDYVKGLQGGTDIFASYKSLLKSGEILVKDKKTGRIGAIPSVEFNGNLYSPL